MRAETHSELIHRARKIEFESCKKLEKRSDSEISKKNGGIMRRKEFFFFSKHLSNIFQKKSFSTSFHLYLSSLSLDPLIFSFVFSLLIHLLSSLLFSSTRPRGCRSVNLSIPTACQNLVSFPRVVGGASVDSLQNRDSIDCRRNGHLTPF